MTDQRAIQTVCNAPQEEQAAYQRKWKKIRIAGCWCIVHRSTYFCLLKMIEWQITEYVSGICKSFAFFCVLMPDFSKGSALQTYKQHT
jgi:hypothetical protein